MDVHRIPLPTAFAAAVLLAAPALAQEICVDPAEAGCEDTIQAGVDAAATGQVIRIAAGNYTENVVVTTEGLTLRGDGIRETIVRAPEDPGGPGFLLLGAPNVVLTGLSVRSEDDFGIFIDEDSPGVRLEQVEVTDVAGGDCVESLADGTVIEDSEFGPCSDDCVAVEGDGFLMSDTEVAGCGDEGVVAGGAGIVIEKSEVTRTGDDCIQLSGDGGTLTDNELSVCDGDGIDYVGDDPLIDGNEVWATTARGIYVECDEDCTSGRVSDNEIRDVGGDGIGFDGDVDGSFSIEENGVEYAAGDGIGVSGDGVTLTKNRVEASGSAADECFDLFGDDLVVEKNTAEACAGDGFRIAGDTGTYRRNRAKENQEDGFDLEGEEEDDGLSLGNTLDGNKAKKNGNHGFELSGEVDDGFESGAVATALVENKAKKNRRADLCDAGLDTAEDGSNSFDTVDAERDEDEDCLEF